MHMTLLDEYPKEFKTYVHTKTCTPMFIATLFTIAKRWKHSKCPSVDIQIKKMCIYIVGYYSALKMNESLSYATTWMILEDIISEISQSQKDKHYRIPLI